MPKVLGLSTTENYMMEHGHSVQAEVKKMFEETNARYKAAIDKHQRHNVFQKGMWSSNVRRGFYQGRLNVFGGLRQKLIILF